ncbi:hypothetical protein MTO96_016170 [Rhipicephalus appendiculatus]
MSPPRPGGGSEGCDLLRSDIVFKTLQRKGSVLFDKLARHGSLADFVLPDSDDGMTLLHLVVSVDDFSAEFLDKLLDSGADPNAASAGGVTAPHIAAAAGNEEALRRLIGRSGDPRRRDPAGNDVFDILVANEHWCCLWRVRGLLGLPVEDGGDPEAAASRLNGASPHPVEDLNDASVVSGVNLDVSPCLSTPSDVSTETESLLNTAYVFPHPHLSPVYVDDERAGLRKRQRGTAADGRDAAHAYKSVLPATSESSSFDGDSCDDDEVANPTDDSSWASSNLPLELLRLSDEELRELLAACYGHEVGPVLDSKRNVHRHALAHKRLGPCARVRLNSFDACFRSTSNGNNRAGIARTCDFCEVVHKDPDTGFVLKEEHYHSSSEADSSGTSEVSSSGAENDTVVVHPELACHTNEQLFAKLTSLGDAPGPVTDGTRALRWPCCEDSSVTLCPMQTLSFTERHTTRAPARVVEEPLATTFSVSSAPRPSAGGSTMPLRLTSFATCEGHAIKRKARATAASETSEADREDDKIFIEPDASSHELPEVLPSRVISPEDNWSWSYGETNLEEGGRGADRADQRALCAAHGAHRSATGTVAKAGDCSSRRGRTGRAVASGIRHRPFERGVFVAKARRPSPGTGHTGNSGET